MLITAEKMHKINVGCDSMADTKTPEERSKNMSHIRSTNTKPEELVRKYLFTHGFRYRKNDKRYPGKPDIVLPKYHTVIFVNGCFGTCMDVPGQDCLGQIRNIGSRRLNVMHRGIRTISENLKIQVGK